MTFSNLGKKVEADSIYEVEYGVSDCDTVVAICDSENHLCFARIKEYEFAGFLIVRRDTCIPIYGPELEFSKKIILNEKIQIPNSNILDEEDFSVEKLLNSLHLEGMAFCCVKIGADEMFIGKILFLTDDHFCLQAISSEGDESREVFNLDLVEQIHFCGSYEEAIGRYAFPNAEAS
ncbi:MAG: hypothetical protein ABJD13_15810 [Paracoccaceae bacterium]